MAYVKLVVWTATLAGRWVPELYHVDMMVRLEHNVATVPLIYASHRMP